MAFSCAQSVKSDEGEHKSIQVCILPPMIKILILILRIFRRTLIGLAIEHGCDLLLRRLLDELKYPRYITKDYGEGILNEDDPMPRSMRLFVDSSTTTFPPTSFLGQAANAKQVHIANVLLKEYHVDPNGDMLAYNQVLYLHLHYISLSIYLSLSLLSTPNAPRHNFTYTFPIETISVGCLKGRCRDVQAVDRSRSGCQCGVSPSSGSILFEPYSPYSRMVYPLQVRISSLIAFISLSIYYLYLFNHFIILLFVICMFTILFVFIFFFVEIFAFVLIQDFFTSLGR